MELCVIGPGGIRRLILAISLLVIGIAIVAGTNETEAKPPPGVGRPEVRTVTVTKTVSVPVTPTACNQLVTDTDAFLEVTDDFLTAGNSALDALLAFDDQALNRQLDRMHHLQGRYETVMDRYMKSREGCL